MWFVMCDIVRLSQRQLCCSQVLPRLVLGTQRRKIEETSRKRYGGNNRQRKRYEVEIKSKQVLTLSQTILLKLMKGQSQDKKSKKCPIPTTSR